MISAESTLFVCPKCGKPTLSSHRKTYEKTVIFFCTNCRLSVTYEPSKDAYMDAMLCWQEFVAGYGQTKA